MRRLIRLLLIALITLSGVSLQAQEVTKVGTTAAKFLSIPVGARALAMGGAYTALANDASAIYWNPGGLAQVTTREVFFMHSEWLADINFDHFALALGSGNMGTFGLSVTAMTIGEMEVTTEDQPDGTGEFFDASSFAFGLSFSRRITEDFMIGANVKYVLEKIWSSSASGLAVDIGTIFDTPFYGVRFGTAISNFGTKMQMSGDNLLVRKDIDPGTTGNNEDVNAILETDKFDLPLNLRIGLARDFNLNEQNRFTMAVDVLYPNDNQQSLNVGAEYAAFNELIFLRGGYRAIFQDESQEEFVVGAGLKHKFGAVGVSLDYAFQSWALLENVHQYSLVLNF